MLSTHAHLVLALEKFSRKFADRAKKARRDPSVSRVHALRVLTRRLRSHFWLIPKENRTSAVRKTLRTLGALADVLGEQRKFDIALKDAIEFSRPTEEIEVSREACKAKVRASLIRGKRKKMACRLESAVEDVRRKVTDEMLRPRLKVLGQRLRRASLHTPQTNEAGHRVRIDSKRARYLLESLGKPLPQLDELQEHLGRWHDLVVLDGMTGHTEKIRREKEREWQSSLKMLKPTLAKASRKIDSLVY